ncbi:nitrilase family protein [Flavobacteriaceae bacterium]|jgi:omega-amidase|nr:nitrilase family protein [Flavobacteriaceae bacterium]
MKSTLLNLALLQFPLAWESPEDNICFFEKKITQAHSQNSQVDLWVLPEMWSTGFSMNLVKNARTIGANSLSFMIDLALKTQSAVAGSTVFEEDSKVFNRFFFVFPDGTYESYDKRHTFSMAGESEVYQKGTTHSIIQFKGFKIFPQVCYDLRFPSWSRNTHDYDLLLYVANWPAPRIHAWDTLLKARAIENMSFCVGVNRLGLDPNGHEYPGHSAAYDCFGKEMLFSNQEGVHLVSLNKESLEIARVNFPFLKDRDTYNLIG